MEEWLNVIGQTIAHEFSDLTELSEIVRMVLRMLLAIIQRRAARHSRPDHSGQYLADCRHWRGSWHGPCRHRHPGDLICPIYPVDSTSQQVAYPARSRLSPMP